MADNTGADNTGADAQSGRTRTFRVGREELIVRRWYEVLSIVKMVSERYQLQLEALQLVVKAGERRDR